MNKVSVLCAMDRVMMETFSRHTVEELVGYTLFRLALPPFKSFFDINLEKETAKDRMVITNAADVLQAGAAPDSTHVVALLREARNIDSVFLRKAAVFPVDIRIQYHEIENYRKKRFELLWNTSYRILAEWQSGRSFRAAVRQLYSEAQFRRLLGEMLRLYVKETRMLSRSVRVPQPLALARDTVTETITKVMHQEAESLSVALARTVYRRDPS